MGHGGNEKNNNVTGIYVFIYVYILCQTKCFLVRALKNRCRVKEDIFFHLLTLSLSADSIMISDESDDKKWYPLRESNITLQGLLIEEAKKNNARYKQTQLMGTKKLLSFQLICQSGQFRRWYQQVFEHFRHRGYLIDHGFYPLLTMVYKCFNIYLLLYRIYLEFLQVHVRSGEIWWFWSLLSADLHRRIRFLAMDETFPLLDCPSFDTI